MGIFWLSHTLSEDTPAYGGGEGFVMQQVKRIAAGSTCNTAKISLSNHLGTHVDAPGHFIEGAKTVDAYTAEEWMFSKPYLLSVAVDAAELISIRHVQSMSIPHDIDLLLFKTNFEQYRQQQHYWQNAPGFKAELADYLYEQHPRLRAIGFDSISLTSMHHRDEGASAHRAFLGHNIRIFEDMHLSELDAATHIQRVMALPLRYRQADGAPCTIIAWTA